MNQPAIMAPQTKVLVVLYAALCFLFFCAAQNARADSPQPAGWIDSFTGTPDHHVLQRGGNSLPVKYYIPLYEGDVVSVKQEDHSLVIALSENESVQVTVSNSPYRVRALSRTPTLAGNLMGWAGDWLTGMAGKNARRDTAMLVTRGTSTRLRIPMLEADAVRLASDRDSLCLAWLGGRPDYRITVTASDEGHARLLDLSTPASTGCWRIPHAPPGDYDLVLIDGNSQFIKASLHLVSHQEVPQLPRELYVSNLSMNAKTTLYSAWLTQSGRDWVLYAYQLAAPLANSYPPAATLANALETGIIPISMDYSQ